ncbi:sugar phosphate isomerase/epimerase family protein [Edaphobacter aggregans]|uniref:sugar phosphate isomerase/epimerase family protein n=1 Tax=Edaphobacter aggregans TaxID=570835 RepID=UPI000552FAA2|nr:sugar phosphate isomerase/epimerase [Edaphobacter aggregans]
MNPTISRRSLIGGGTMLAASALLSDSASSFAAPAQPSSAPIRLGIASYTFRKFDQAHLIAFMKQLNCTLLNLKDVHLPMTPTDQVATRAAEYRAAGLTLTAAGTIYFDKDDDNDIRAKFDYVKAAGIPMIVGSPTRQVLPRVEKFVKEYDIKLAIHNHGPEDKQWPSPLDILAVVDKMDKRIGCCIDVGHTMRAGVDPVTAIKKVGPRLYDMHIKDLAEGNVKESQVAVGDGILPIPGIFRALVDIGYKGNVDLEYEINAEDPMPGVIKSFAYMRGVIAGMGH